MTKLSLKVVDTKIKRVFVQAASVLLIVALMVTLAPIASGSYSFGAEKGETVWAISIGDEEILYLSSEEKAQQVVEGIHDYYLTEGSKVVSVYFDKAIEVVEKKLIEDDSSIRTMTVDAAIKNLIRGSVTLTAHKVEEGETAKSIAKKYDLDYDEFKEFNAEFGKDLGDIEEGSYVLIYEIEPYFNITTSENIITTKSIDYETEYRYSSSMDADESKVITKGEDGKKSILTNVIKVNGETTGKQIVSETVLTEPVTKVILKGTRNIDAKKGKTYDFADGDDIAEFALRYVGNPYVYGGSSLTSGSDCSGFVMAVYDHFGLDLPHTATGQRYYGRSVSYKYAKPGDIICYYGHSAIYIGDGKIVHAFNPYRGICVTSARYDYIVTVRRVFED